MNGSSGSAASASFPFPFLGVDGWSFSLYFRASRSSSVAFSCDLSNFWGVSLAKPWETHPLVYALKQSDLEELASGVADRLVADELPEVAIVTAEVAPSKSCVTVKGAETEAKGLVD